MACADPDPVIAAARLWRDAQARSLSLCRRQQRLETELMRAIHSSPSPGSAAPAAPLDWSKLQVARLQQVDHDFAYSQAKDAEEQAAKIAEQLLEKLARTPAQSLDGVIAKLSVVLREARTHDALSDFFPWTHLRSVLGDLRRLSAEAESGSPSQASR
ncbi:hypothetical protein AB4144_02345 [Rhizobiaceae sp. 2RAB30]